MKVLLELITTKLKVLTNLLIEETIHYTVSSHTVSNHTHTDK